MKNFRRGTSVLAATAVIGLTLAGCGAGNDGGSEGEAVPVHLRDLHPPRDHVASVPWRNTA